jgi:hypothetical protein
MRRWASHLLQNTASARWPPGRAPRWRRSRNSRWRRAPGRAQSVSKTEGRDGENIACAKAGVARTCVDCSRSRKARTPGCSARSRPPWRRAGAAQRQRRRAGAAAAEERAPVPGLQRRHSGGRLHAHACVGAARARTSAFSNSSSLRCASLRTAIGSRAQQNTSDTTCGGRGQVVVFERPCAVLLAHACVMRRARRQPGAARAYRGACARRGDSACAPRAHAAARRGSDPAARHAARGATVETRQVLRVCVVVARATRLRALHAHRLLQHERRRRALAQLLRQREPRLRARRAARGVRAPTREADLCAPSACVCRPCARPNAPPCAPPTRPPR